MVPAPAAFVRALGLVAVVWAPWGAAAQLAPLAAGEGSAPAPPWAYAGLPAQKPPPTRYAIRELDGRRVLQLEAVRSYGNLLHPLRGQAAGVLSWRWRVDQPLAGADLRSKDGDDAALKVCAMFDMPRANVPFVERQLLRLAESRIGEPLPTATLCYVWDPSLPRGTLLRNPYTQRVRTIVLGGAPMQWADEQQDLQADFLRAFGDEAQQVPPLLAIAVGADADNTDGRSLGYLDALVHRPPAGR
jgi:hypothetical protein